MGRVQRLCFELGGVFRCALQVWMTMRAQEETGWKLVRPLHLMNQPQLHVPARCLGVC